MEKIVNRTFEIYKKDYKGIFWDIAKESAIIYNDSKKTALSHYKENKNIISCNDIQKEIYNNYKNFKLSSNSKIAVIQQFDKARRSYFKSLKSYRRDSSKFTGIPTFPTKDKNINCICFKNTSITFKGGYLRLSLSRGNEPIKIKWNANLPIPIFAVLSYSKEYGWKFSLVLQISIEENDSLDEGGLLSIDPGVKRIATTFDGQDTVTYSGKQLMSLIRLRNKMNKKTKLKLKNLKKHSKKYKKINSANREFRKRNNFKINEILHKYSKSIVDYCVNKKIKHIVFGDNSSTHNSPNLGKVWNQEISQGLEQKLRKYIQYKFESIGGTLELVSEHYTSQSCPICGNCYKPSSRFYKCKKCGFKFDRDGVGAINIWNQEAKVSFGDYLDVVGGLTPPIGVKYHNGSKIVLGFS